MGLFIIGEIGPRSPPQLKNLTQTAARSSLCSNRPLTPKFTPDYALLSVRAHTQGAHLPEDPVYASRRKRHSKHARATRPDMPTHGLGLKSWAFRKPRSVLSKFSFQTDFHLISLAIITNVPDHQQRVQQRAKVSATFKTRADYRRGSPARTNSGILAASVLLYLYLNDARILCVCHHVLSTSGCFYATS